MTLHTSVELALYGRRLRTRSKDHIDIRSLRYRLGWSQKQLADYLGLDRSSVSRMENDQEPKGPTKRLLQALAAQAQSEQPAPASEAAQ